MNRGRGEKTIKIIIFLQDVLIVEKKATNLLSALKKNSKEIKTDQAEIKIFQNMMKRLSI